MPPGPRIPRPKIRLGARLTPAVTWLIALYVATFLVFTFSGESTQTQLVRWIVLTPGSILEGHVWKLLTTTLFPGSPVAFVLDMLVMWLFLPFLEREWGMRRFLRFAAITTVAGNLAAVGIGLLIGARGVPIAGLSAFVYACLIGYGVAFGNRPIQFFGVIPMKGKTLAIGIAVVVVLAAIINKDWVQGGGHIAAMVTAFFLTTRDFTPRLWILKWRRARLRKRYTVLDGGAREKKQWLN